MSLRVCFICIAASASLLSSVASAAPPAVALIDLLSHPQRYDGRRVSVTGYYYTDSETSCLYVDRAASKQGGVDRSIWVEYRGVPDVTAIDHRQARLVGTFHYRPKARPDDMRGYGSWGVWTAALQDTTSFERAR